VKIPIENLLQRYHNRQEQLQDQQGVPDPNPPGVYSVPYPPAAVEAVVYAVSWWTYFK